MDNCSCHRSNDLKQFYLENDLNIFYGPPYTPEINLVEYCFSIYEKKTQSKILKTE